MAEKLAIIKDVHCGVSDRGKFALRLTVYDSECSAALQVWEDLAEIAKIVEAYGVSDVGALNGKPCWVEVGNGLMKWVRPWKT